MKKVLLILCALMVTQLAGAWYLVGGSAALQSWNAGSAIAPTTTENGIEIFEGISLDKNVEFKFLKSQAWGTELTTGGNVTTVGTAYTLKTSGNNTKWTGASGTYDLKLDPTNKKLTIVKSTVAPEVLEIPDGIFSFYEGETVAFFVNNGKWSKVNAYVWNGSGNNGWPGQAMTVVDGVSINNKYNAYKWTASSLIPTQIIFNNGSSQTKDIAFVNGGVYDVNGNLLKTIVPTVALEPTVTLNYSPEAIYTNTTVTLSATVLDGDGMTVEYLVNDEKLSGNKWTPTTAGSYTLTANLVDGTTVKATDSKTVTVKESTLFTVYLEKSSAWTTTYIYCWGGYGNTWPGDKLTATETVNGVDYYKWDFKNIESVNIIFTDNSGNQTADISNVTKTTYYRLKGKTGNPCGHEEVDPTVKPETLVYNVTVPAHTFECYIIGEFNEWGTFVPMEKVDDTHYTITLDNVYKTSKYKYTSGKGWDYVEKTAAGEEIQDRTYQANDVVAKWNKKPAVEEHIVAGRMYSLNLGEDCEWENPVMQTVRRKAAPTAFELFEDFDDDTHFANGGIVPDGWLSTGAMAPKREKAGLYETGYDAHSGSYMLNTLDQMGALRDEVLYTPMMKLAGGKEATISFYIYAPGGSPAAFYSYVDVKAGTAQSLDAQTIALGATSSAHPSWTELKYVFTPEADGEYCFSIAMKQSTELLRDHGFIGIDDVTITGYAPAEGGEPVTPPSGEPTAFEFFEDFDDDTHFANGGIVPDGWLSTGAMAPKREKAGLYETGYDAHSGSYMLNTLDQMGALRDEVLYTPMMKLAGGKEATISFYIYAPGGSPAAFYSYVDVKAGTAQSLDAQTIALGATSSAHPSWTELKYVFTPEADGEYCFSIAMKQSTELSRDHGFIGIDDVTITGYTPAEGGSEEPEQPENPEQPAEPVAFESFEDFDDASHFANGGIAPDGWLSTGGQALTRFQGGAWYTGYDAHSGDYVMHSEHNSAGRDEILYTPMMKLAGGKEATISFYLIAPGGSPASAFYAQVSVKAGTAQTADALTVDLGTTSTYYSTWHELKYTFTPAEDGEYCFAIALGLSSLNYGRSHGYVGIDDVTITGYTPAEGGSDEPEQPVVPEGDFWYAAKFINYNTGAYTWAKADSYDAEYNSYMFYLAEGNMPATRAAEDNKYTHVQFVQYASEEVAPENLHTLTLANATNKTGELYFDGTTSTVYDLQNEVWKAIGTMLDEVEAEPTIEYAGYVVFAEGAIEVYNLNGVVVARGYDSVDLRNQVRGIYIVRAGEQVRKVVR